MQISAYKITVFSCPIGPVTVQRHFAAKKFLLMRNMRKQPSWVKNGRLFRWAVRECFRHEIKFGDRIRVIKHIRFSQMRIFCLSLRLRKIIDPLIHESAKLILRPSHKPFLRHFHSNRDFFLSVFVLGEISDVKDMSIDFVRKTLEKKGTSFTYILVPFSDPGRHQVVICYKYVAF